MKLLGYANGIFDWDDYANSGKKNTFLANYWKTFILPSILVKPQYNVHQATAEVATGCPACSHWTVCLHSSTYENSIRWIMHSVNIILVTYKWQSAVFIIRSKSSTFFANSWCTSHPCVSLYFSFMFHSKRTVEHQVWISDCMHLHGCIL
jgi:hypothetical protein